MSTKKYEILKHFRWGPLFLETGQKLIITKMTQNQSLVQVYGTEKTITVHSGAVLSKIEVEILREV